MQVFIITESLVQGRYWSSGYNKGIRQETLKIKGKYREIPLDDLAIILEEDCAAGRCPTAIVNGVSQAWTAACLERLQKAGIHPLLLTPFGGEIQGGYSTVSFDFYTTFLSLFLYLKQEGKPCIALVGLNPGSVNDIVKRRAFAAYQQTTPDQAEHIFWNQGSLQGCCQCLYEHLEDYDAVVCTNDVVAIKLITFLSAHGVRVPEDLWVAAMGNTLLGGLISPQITVAEMDCVAIGRQAVAIYAFLKRHSGISSLRAVVPGRILTRASTAGKPAREPATVCPPATEIHPTVDFYSDEDVANIFRLENLFRYCEETDRQILAGMLAGETYAALAERVFLSERTVKYRVRRMVELAGCSSRARLLALLTQYIV